MNNSLSGFAVLLLATLVELSHGADISAFSAERIVNSTLLKAIDSIDRQELKAHVSFLASDALEGREAGSEGSRAAAVYLTDLFESNGLKPAGTGDTYEQSFGKNYRNLLGLLPGSDPDCADEVIVIGAHYDHVGYGYSGNSRGTVGKIHNGADDNGSGVAALIEIIQAIQLAEIRPRRSILFVLWDAEELGLLGSKHWTRSPTIDLNRVKFYINLDMVGRLRNNQVEVFGCRTADGLRRLCAVTNEDQLELAFTWNIIPDSDHYPFLRKNIPYLMPFTRKHEDYHRASDDFDKVNYEGQEKIVRHWLRILLALTDQEQVPTYRAACRQEHEGLKKRLQQASQHRKTSRVGVSWNREESDAAKALIIHNVTVNAPAWNAGLRSGDRILSINGQSFETSSQFIADVSASVPESRVTVQRADSEESEEISLNLTGKPSLVGLEFREDSAETTSLIISRVIPDSPADKAGLRSHDRIVRVSGPDFPSGDPEAESLLSAQSPVELEWERHGIVSRATLQPLPRLEPTAPAAGD